MRSKISRLLSLILALALVLTAGGFSDTQSVYAKSKKKKAPEAVKVYVTITDNNGKIVFRQSGVEATDADGDGTLTINDALIVAHDMKYKGGAAAGYEYVDGAQYGLTGYTLSKLWGIENGGAYGIGKNNEFSAIGLADTIEEGDFIDAYCYRDLKKFSDKYSFFNVRLMEVKRGEEVKLKLAYNGYDSNYEVVVKPVKNAAILDNNKETGLKVNKKGVVKYSSDILGGHFISAVSTKKKTVLVPPACLIYVLPNKGNLLTPDKTTGIKYKVITAGSVLNNEAGTVEVYENANDAEVPDTIEFGSVTYNVVK